MPNNAFLADLGISIPDLDDNLDGPAIAGPLGAIATDAGPDAGPADTEGRLLTATAVNRYALAGKATITLVSEKTKKRFTFRISASKPREGQAVCYFVAVLTGPDNVADYRYLGRISRGLFWHGRKASQPTDISADAPSAKAFAYAWRALMRGTMPDQCQIWHSSSCGRCGHPLTVPSSVSQGFGPECVNKIGLA